MSDPQKTVYINFFDSIDPVKVNKFINFTVDAIKQHDPTEIYYFISSNVERFGVRPDYGFC